VQSCCARVTRFSRDRLVCWWSGPGRSRTQAASPAVPSKEEAKLTEDGFPSGTFVSKTDESWVLQFNDDGTYLFFANGVVDATGIYSITGDLYIETTDYAPCRHAKTATYRWAYDGRRLTFQLVGEDDCSPRRSSLDGVSWIRRPHAQATAPGEESSGSPKEK
jgi:hypothetical protein